MVTHGYTTREIERAIKSGTILAAETNDNTPRRWQVNAAQVVAFRELPVVTAELA